WLEVPQPAEVDDHHRAAEGLQDEDELALGDEVGLERLKDQRRDLARRLVDREVLELHVGDEAEEHPEDADEETAKEQVVTGDPPQEVDGAEVGEQEIGFARRGGGGGEEQGGERGQPWQQTPDEGSPPPV